MKPNNSMEAIPKITDRFDKNDFKDIDCFKCKFYNSDLIVCYKDLYIKVQDAFKHNIIKLSDMQKF